MENNIMTGTASDNMTLGGDMEISDESLDNLKASGFSDQSVKNEEESEKEKSSGEEGKEVKTTKKETEVESDENPFIDKTNQDNDKEKEKEKSTEEEEESDGLKLNIPDEKDKKDILSENTVFQNLAEDLGFNSSAEDVDGFKNDLDEYVQSKVEDAVSAVEVDTEAILGNMAPKARQLVEFLNDGGNIDDVYSTTSEFDKYLMLDNLSLSKEDLKAQGLDDNEIAIEIANLEDTGRLGIFAKKVRNDLSSLRDKEVNDLAGRQKEYSDNLEKQEETIKQENFTAIKKSLDNIKDFYGAKVEKEHRDYIIAEWKSGRVAEKVNDPDFMANVLLSDAFGKDLFEQVKKSAFQDGTSKIKEKLHNLPTKAGGSRTVKTETNSEDFGAWSSINSDDNVVVER